MTADNRTALQEKRAPQRASFVAALMHVMKLKRVTHRQLGDALGQSHTTVTGWKRLDHEPDPWTTFEIERILDLPPGLLSIHLGYLPPKARSGPMPNEVLADAIDADPSLDERGRRVLRHVYDYARGK